MEKTTARDLRRVNRSTVLRSLYYGEATNRLDLSQRTGLSAGTITNVVGEFLAEGSVIEAGSEESQGGRPRTTLSMNGQHGYFAGVDVGETSIRIELFDLLLHRVGDSQSHPIAGLRHPEEVVERIASGIHDVLTAERIAREHVLGVGVGVPGMVTQAEQGLTRRTAARAAITVIAPSIGWIHVPLLSMLERRLDYPIFLDNGAKAMTQAEALVGAGRGVDHFAAVLVGTGVGAGIIADGKLFRGATNSAGEWGHTKIALDGRACRCGSSGCLEAYVGATALLARWHELAPDRATASAETEEAQIAALLAAALATDAMDATGPSVERQILRETTQYLALGLANLINLCNPQRIALGGWVGTRLGPIILPELRAATQRLALQTPFDAVSIELSHLGHDAVALGAATLALEHFLASGGRSRATRATDSAVATISPSPAMRSRPRIQ